MKEQIIHLEPHDDAISARDKLSWIRASRVLLVFPADPRQRILQRKLDLVILQREVTRRRAHLALITRDPVVMEHAHELGIACFPTVTASQKQYWRTARARLTVKRSEQPQPLDIDMVEGGTRLRTDSGSLSPQARRAATLLLFGTTLLVLLITTYMTVPGATIYLVPAANQVSVTTVVTADPAASVIDTSGGVIPSRLVGVEVESSATIDSTGTKDVPSQKARGVALFTNLLPDQVVIPQGTIVRTSAAQPVRFVTLTDATLPGQIGGTVEVAIEAVEPGFEGNLPGARVNQIEGPLATRVAVTNSEPTRGGDVTQVPAISQEDHDQLRALLLQQLQQRAFAEMQTDPYIALQDTEFIPVESLVVVLVHAETYVGYVGQTLEQVSLDMRVTVQGLAIDERLARQVVYAQLADKVGTGYQIAAGSLIFRQGEVTGVDEQRRVSFIMQGAGDVSAAIYPAEVQRLVRGVTIAEAVARLDRELPLAAPPIIRTWPSFWPLMPALPLRIQVEVEGQL